MGAFILEQSCSDSRRHDGPESGPNKVQIRRENTNSRRFLASNSKRFIIENEMSSRSNVTISSTVSSPGYSIRGEIDPSTYSFTTALKALQARSVYSWEYIDGLTLNSKWNDAEKYICNPLSGQVPLECLSAKTLSSRSLSSRITMSAPLVFPPHLHPKSPIIQHHHNHSHVKFTVQEEKKSGTRDVGIQSTADYVIVSSESSYSPELERSTKESGEETGDSSVYSPELERSTKESEGETGDSSVCSGKQKPETEVEVRESGRERKKVMMMWRCVDGEAGRRGCGLSLKGLWQRDKCKSRDNKINNLTSSPTFHYHVNACFNE